MEYKKIDCSSFKLHLIKTNKFKTINFKLIFRDEIKKNEITLRNVLIDNLVFSSKKYNSRKKMTIKKQELYGVDIYGSNKRIGNHIITEMTMTLLNPKYTEQNMLAESLDFLKEIIFNPNVENDEFQEEIFEVIKQNNYFDINTNLENPNYVVVQELREKLAYSSPISYKMAGYTEDLRNITAKNLYDYYKKFLISNCIDIYVLGDFDPYEMEKIVKKKFKFKTITKKRKEIPIKLVTKNIFPKVYKKNSNFVQTNLAIAGLFKNISWWESKYPCALFNIILGNSPESKFFQDIREKYSCAYTINSTYRRQDDYVLITAGIAVKNYNLVIKRIKHCIKEMQKGLITDDEIITAKELYTNVIKEIEDFPSSIIEYYFSLEYLNNDTLEVQASTMLSITKEQIIQAAKKFKINTIFLLKEREQDENN